jgi:hypothetical protein
MKNNAELLLKAVYKKIPKQILEMALLRHSPNSTIPSRLMSEIIESTLLDDVNKWGGKPKSFMIEAAYRVDLEWDSSRIATHPKAVAYRIPPEVRDNAPIVAVHRVAYPPYYTNTGNPYSSGNSSLVASQSVPGLAAGLLNGQTFENSDIEPTARVIGGDMLLLEPACLIYDNWRIECSLAYDKYFSNANQDLIPVLEKLMVLGTKAYCYNELYLDLGSVHMVGGQAHSRISQMIEKYSDAAAQYDEQLKEVRGGLALDPDIQRNLLRYMF